MRMSKILGALRLMIMDACARPNPKVQRLRTAGDFQRDTGVYTNTIIPLRVTFPTEQWTIYTSSECAPEGLAEAFRSMSGGGPGTISLVMAGQHVNNIIWTTLTVEPGVRGLSPQQYVLLVTEANRVDLERVDVQEEFLRERHTKERTWAEWGYRTTLPEGPAQGTQAVNREVVLLHNEYACRLRIWTLASFYEVYKSIFEEILTHIEPLPVVGRARSPF